jgi:hypothetical protein
LLNFRSGTGRWNCSGEAVGISDPRMYRLTVSALLAEAAAFVCCGFLIGLIYGDWRAVVAAQALLMACEGAGYAIEGWLRRRRERRAAQ